MAKLNPCPYHFYLAHASAASIFSPGEPVCPSLGQLPPTPHPVHALRRLKYWLMDSLEHARQLIRAGQQTQITYFQSWSFSIIIKKQACSCKIYFFTFYIYGIHPFYLPSSVQIQYKEDKLCMNTFSIADESRKCWQPRHIK